MELTRKALAAALCLAALSSPAAGEALAPQAPLNAVYLEAGPTASFSCNLQALAQALSERRLTRWSGGSFAGIDRDMASSAVWGTLATLSKDSRIRFLADGFYSGQWAPGAVKLKADEIEKRIRERGDVGLVMAFGTQAAIAAKAMKTDVPVVAFQVTDPVNAGLTATENRSGQANFFVRTAGPRTERQLALFHRLFPFKKLGVIADESRLGQAQAGIPAMQHAARQLGFSVIPCRARIFSQHPQQASQALLTCVRELASKGIDAFCLTRHNVPDKELRTALDILTDKNIPSVTTTGVHDVRNGVLMSLTPNRFIQAGIFEAGVIQEIADGKRPGDLNELYITYPTASLNLRTAARLNWAPPIELLASVDETFQ